MSTKKLLAHRVESVCWHCCPFSRQRQQKTYSSPACCRRVDCQFITRCLDPCLKSRSEFCWLLRLLPCCCSHSAGQRRRSRVTFYQLSSLTRICDTEPDGSSPLVEIGRCISSRNTRKHTETIFNQARPGEAGVTTVCGAYRQTDRQTAMTVNWSPCRQTFGSFFHVYAYIFSLGGVDRPKDPHTRTHSQRHRHTDVHVLTGMPGSQGFACMISSASLETATDPRLWNSSRPYQVVSSGLLVEHSLEELSLTDSSCLLWPRGYRICRHDCHCRHLRAAPNEVSRRPCRPIGSFHLPTHPAAQLHLLASSDCPDAECPPGRPGGLHMVCDLKKTSYVMARLGKQPASLSPANLLSTDPIASGPLRQLAATSAIGRGRGLELDLCPDSEPETHLGPNSDSDCDSDCDSDPEQSHPSEVFFTPPIGRSQTMELPGSRSPAKVASSSSSGIGPTLGSVQPINGERMSRTNLYIKGLPDNFSDDRLWGLVPDPAQVRSVKAATEEDEKCRGNSDKRTQSSSCCYFVVKLES
ncbi:unnamed protein product [Protopolystoma xenopodis]|uniref:RRM domain-containing protein n=1 Tax=Protopolystoma xenopodis TaxID=117903 RepID=A0A3S5B1Z1_9PLAT|nr:unnamed protein product [Protopolystoma xenopodis]